MPKIGERFGKIVVVGQTDKRDNNGYILWKIKCDCGTERLTRSTNLNSGVKRLPK